MLLPLQINAQGEANNWIMTIDHFLSFNSGSPELITPPNGTECPDWSAGYCDFFFTAYCGSSISDKDGNLLFYSNGEVIWDSTLDTIYDLGTFMQWRTFSNQCLFIPKPGNPNRFYLFTTPFIHSNNGVKYYELDLSLNGGTGGLIVPYNIQLLSPVCQKVTAVYHANGRDIWVMVHEWNSNAFYAYLVTKDGISNTPIITNIGTVHQIPTPPNSHSFDSGSAGEMKFATNGKRLVVAILGLDIFEIFDFDNETGVVSNALTIVIEDPLSVEFSPDGTLAYLGTSSKWSTLDSVWIYQVDLLAGSQSQILNSFMPINNFSTNNSGQYHLQLASDKKIYSLSSLDEAISILHYPNASGFACNWVYNDFPVPTNYCGTSLRMLPNFFRSYLDKNILFSDQCLGDTTLICTQTNTDFDSIRWEFTDPLAGLISIPNQDTIYHLFQAPGSYEITLKRYRNYGNLDETKRMLYIHPVLDISLGNDTIICEGSQTTLMANEPFCQFAWVNNFTTDTVWSDTTQAYGSGNWWPVLTNFDEYCGTIDTILIDVYVDSLDLGSDTTGACITNLLSLDATIAGALTYLWSTGDTTAIVLADESDAYAVTVSSGICEFTDTIGVLYDELLELELLDTVMSCDSTQIELNAGDFPATFIWSPNGQTGAVIQVTTPGMYSVTASNNCGSFVDSTLVVAINQPVINLPVDTIACLGDTVYLNAGNPGSNYTWSDGSTSNLYAAGAPGIYSLTVSNACDTSSGQTLVIYQKPVVIHPANDTTICNGTEIWLTSTYSPLTTYFWSTGEFTNNIIVDSAGTYTLMAINVCGNFLDTVEVNKHENLFSFSQDSVGIDTLQSIILDAGAVYQSYLWSTMAITQSITVSDPGNYWVEVIDSMYCLGSDTIVVYRLTDISSSQLLSNIQVFPNPVKDELVVEGRFDNIQLYNSVGQMVFTHGAPFTQGFTRSESLSGYETRNHFAINFSNFPKGIYLLSIGDGKSRIAFKVLK